MTTTKNQASAYASLLVDFFEELRSRYSFPIGVSEMSRAIQAVQDLCDVEDVMYTTQAAICRSPAQIDTFQALFCQKFLHYQKVSNANKKPGEKAPKDPGVTVEDAVERLHKAQAEYKRAQENKDIARKEAQTALQSAEQRLSDDTTDAAELRKSLTSLESEYRKFKEESALSETPEALRTAALSAFGDLYRQEKYSGGLNRETWRGIIRNGSQREVQNLQSTAMAKALKFRNQQDIEGYRAFLNLASLLQKLANELSKGARKAASNDRGKGYLSRIRSLKTKIEKANKEVESSQRRVEEAEKKLKSVNAQSWQAQAKLSSAQTMYNRARAYEQHLQESLIVKDKSQHHRDIFLSGHNSVQTSVQDEMTLNKPLGSLSNADIANITRYLRTNARYFRQTLRREYSSTKHKKIDIKKTIKSSMRTSGDITKIAFCEPKKSKAKVVLLADISGSCRVCTSLALNYLGLMGEAFPGGCHQFVFVNSLINIDRYFRQNTVETAVQKINQDIDTRGYSDYGRPITELVNNYSGLFGKETTLIVIGDARNNRHDIAADNVRWLKEHTHAFHLLNPDSIHKWNTGDSVVSQYEALGVKSHHVGNCSDLLSFLSSPCK